jgi:hypothetical protein
MSENSKIMEEFIGKRIVSVKDTNTGKWYDSQGFILGFHDGCQIEINGDMAQGFGYVILTNKNKDEDHDS